jgi:hypothetical protein
MRKAQCVDLLARTLGVRATRLTSLTQRLADAGFVHTSSGPPYSDVSPTEVARMLIVAIADEGLAAAPDTIRRLGSLLGRGCNLEQGLSHALSRPESLAPCRAGLELHVGDQPYAVLTTTSADGALSNVFGDIPVAENIDRLVTVSGAALYSIAMEIAGVSPAEVDALLGAKPAFKPKEVEVDD